MPFCEYCGNEIGYLPFNCNYCGGTFCKQHRLPENHECSFELKHKPAVETTKKIRRSNQEVARPISQNYLYNGPKQLKKYLKRQEKERRRTRRVSQQGYGRVRRPWKLGNGTLFIILMILIFSAIEIARFNFDPNGLYNLGGLPAIYIWRVFTSPFVYTQDLLGFFFLFIMIYFLRFMGQMIEVQYGTKFLLKFYFLCVLFNIGLYALILLPFSIIYYPTPFIFIPVASASAPIFGIIALMLLPMMNRQVTGIVGFFPARTSGKTFLWIIILLLMVPGLLLFFIYGNPIYLAESFANLGGLLVAYLVVHQVIRLKN